MKQCPTCRRAYADETLNYCLDDGASLVYAGAGDEPATAVLPPAATSPGEAPTVNYDPRGNSSAAAELLPAAARPSSNRNMLLYAIGAAGLAVVLVVVGYIYYPRTSAATQIESIAVMPFQNASGNADIEYLSDGITESLINSLSRLPKLAVKARSSVFTYKGKDTTPRQVAKDLSVQAILNGRVTQRGDQLLLSLELVDAATGNQIWGEQYVRKATDLTSLQSEIARDVSNKLRSKLSGADEQSLAKDYTENTEALQMYLRGKFHWNKRTRNDLLKSVEYFHQAVEKDPSYALAWAGLAEAYILLPQYAGESPHVGYPKGKAAALRAMELDNSLAEPHAVLATIMNEYEWKFDAAEEEYRRAIELNPNYATGHHWYAEYLLSRGRLDEALAEMRRARELDPLSLIINGLLGIIMQLNGQTDEAVEQLKKTVALDPTFPRGYLFLAQVYEAKGMFNEAADEFGKLSGLVGVPPEEGAKAVTSLKQAFKTQGARGYYRRLAEILSERGQTSAPPPASVIAGYWVMGGETDKAIAILEEALARREPEMVRIAGPVFDPIKSDPRYKDIVRRMNVSN